MPLKVCPKLCGALAGLFGNRVMPGRRRRFCGIVHRGIVHRGIVDNAARLHFGHGR